MMSKIDSGEGSKVERLYPGDSSEISAQHGRHAVVAEVRASLENRAGNGVILVGEYGVGKSFVARQVVNAIRLDALVLSLRCSSSTAGIDYGALGPMLNDLGVTDLGEISVAGPLEVLSCTARVLAEQANGQKVVLFIDNVQNLDDASALVITQLAVKGVISVLAACESLTSAPTEIIGLWRDGLLHRVDVPPFSEAATAQWLENVMNSQISRAAAEALWTAGGGNPRFLEVIMHEQIQARTLIKRDDVWVMTGQPFVCGNNAVDTVMTAIGSVAPAERMVAELLALSAGLPLNQLMEICDVDAVDALQQRGFLSISRDESGTVRLSNRLMAQVLREQVPAGRSRELHHLVESSAASPRQSAGTDFFMAVWGLDCGIALDLEEGVGAARAATQAGFPQEALRIIDSLPRHLSLSSLIPEKARAMVALGQEARARSLVFDPELEVEQLSLRQWTELMFLRAALSRGQEQQGSGPKEILDQVKARLDIEDLQDNVEGGSDRMPGLADLREDLAMNTAEQMMLDGRYLESLETLKILCKKGRSSDTRLLAARWMIEGWFLVGRVSDALNLAEEIELRFLDGEGERSAPELADAALVGAVVASLTAAGLGLRTGCPPTGMFIGARIAAFAELAEGLVDAYNGRAERALAHLLPAASQLGELGELGTSALASAATAFAHALAGENDEALQFLNKAKPKGVAASRLVATASSYFQVLTTAELASKEKAVVRLFALADDQRRYQTTAVEMVFILGAVRLGNIGGAQRLVSLANRVQGPMGRICEGFGQGLMSRDTVTLLRVAEAAANLGDDLLSRDVARAALKIASENSDKDGMRLAQQLIRGGMLKLGRVKVSSEDGQVLTAREQEIAAHAAAGESNKAIAARMHISVRTVEGHLYQVYAKLQVTSRAELRATMV